MKETIRPFSCRRLQSSHTHTHTHTHTLYSKLYLLEKNKKLVSTDPLTWVWATLTFVEAQEEILSVWAKTEQWISMMDSLSWQAVPLHTWGFPVMSDFSHGQLELLLAFNRGPALNPLYNLWPSFVLPGAQPFFLKSWYFFCFLSWLFLSTCLCSSSSHFPVSHPGDFLFFSSSPLFLKCSFTPLHPLSLFSHSLHPEQDLLKFRPAGRFLCTGCVITKAGSPTNTESSVSQRL